MVGIPEAQPVVKTGLEDLDQSSDFLTVRETYWGNGPVRFSWTSSIETSSGKSFCCLVMSPKVRARSTMGKRLSS